MQSDRRSTNSLTNKDTPAASCATLTCSLRVRELATKLVACFLVYVA